MVQKVHNFKERNFSKDIFGKSHPNSFEIIDVMRKEQATTEMKLDQFEVGAMQPSRKRRYLQEMKESSFERFQNGWTSNWK